MTPEHDDMRDSVDTEDEDSVPRLSARRHGSLQLRIVSASQQEEEKLDEDSGGRGVKRKCQAD